MAFDLLDIQNDVYKYEANEGQMKEVPKTNTHPSKIFCATSNFFVYKSIHPQTSQIVFCVFLPRTMTAKSDPG